MFIISGSHTPQKGFSTAPYNCVIYSRVTALEYWKQDYKHLHCKFLQHWETLRSNASKLKFFHSIFTSPTEDERY
jgi:hypothetical protein